MNYFELEVSHQGLDYRVEYEFEPGRSYPQTSFDPPDPPDPPECEITALWVYDENQDDFVRVRTSEKAEQILDACFDDLVEHAESEI